MSLRPLYARPRTLADAGALLASIKTGAVVIAGGQDMMPHINHGRLMPAAVIDIGAVAELRGITTSADVVSIGALVTHRDLEHDATIARLLPILAAGAGQIGGGRQVRNRGTVGGNIAAQHPLYDIAPPLLALEAEIEIHGDGATHRIALAAALNDAGIGLGARSILARIHVSAPEPGTGWAYRKLKATGGAYGSANAAALVALTRNEVSTLRIVIGAASERLVDATAALAHLIGRTWNEHMADEIEAVCAGAIGEPLSDHQGGGAWRRAMAGVMARRAVTDAVARTKAA